jgi:TIGR03009 family protein
MTQRIGWLTTVGLLLAVGSAAAQTQPWRGSPAGPRPSASQPPRLRQAPAPARPAQAPFQLTPREQANLDWVLNTWQQRSAKVKTYKCSFTRWEYDPVFGDPNKPAVDEGEVNYRSPDKGTFWVKKPKERQERWICDGKSMYQYDFRKKLLIQHKLPPELQGKAIVESPLPFIFGAEAAKLRQRYFLKISTPPDVQGKQTWLEAYPRQQRDAANFRRAELILTNKNMTPYALQIDAPNGQNRTVYQFRDIVVNDPLDFLKNPFHVLTPPFWKKIVEEPPAPQISRQLGPPARR